MDFAGVWMTKSYASALKPMNGQPIPFTAEGRKRLAKAKAAVAADREADPSRELCMPQGPARAMTTAYPFRIFQTDKLFVLVFEENRTFQRIRVDGTFHDPELWDPSYMGDSIGKWEGNSLVVRTTNFRPEIFLDDSLLPGSENTEIQQRFTLGQDGRSMDVLVTIADPKLYARPWTAKLSYELRPDLEVETSDWICGEPHRDVSAVPGLASAPPSHPSHGATREPLAVPIKSKPTELTDERRNFRAIWSMLAAGLTAPPQAPALADGTPAPKLTDSLFPDSLTRLLMPWNLAPYQELREKMSKAVMFPTPDNSCLPYAIPSTAAYYGPYEVLVGEEKTLLLFQLDHQSRIVHMGGEMPANPALSFSGTSVGHWDGSELVITTTGYNNRTLPKEVVRHSDRLTVIERMRLSEDGKSLLVNNYFEDPGALTGTWHLEVRPARDPDDYQEYASVEVEGSYPCPRASTGSTFPRYEQPKR